MLFPKYQINSFDNEIIFSFLQDYDFIKPNALNKQNFGQNHNLDDFIQINSENSGVTINSRLLFDITPVIAAEIFKEFQKNPSLKITDGNLKCYFYSLSVFPEYDQKILYLWHISTSMVSQSKIEWCIQNELVPKNCCLRNALIEDIDLDINNEAEVNQFCKFPKKFIKVNSAVYSHLLNAESQRNKFAQLDLNSHFVSTDNSLTSYRWNTEFLTAAPIKQMVDLNGIINRLEELNPDLKLKKFVKIPPKLNVSPLVARFLKELYNDSLSNYNCKNLLTELSVENETFESFLFDCLITMYTHQKRIIQNRKETKMNIKWLFCEFFF